MRWSPASSAWLRLLALLHVLGRVSAFTLGASRSRERGGISDATAVEVNYCCSRTDAAALSCRWGPRPLRHMERGTGLFMKKSYRDESEAEFYAKRIQNLITHNALLTANTYWMELRGNMYAEWLNRYIEESGGIEDVGWQAFLAGMLRAPPEDIVVKKLIKSPRGGSGNNPYLADRKPMEYTESIEPTSIARRIMAIREQVAEQLGSDLKQMPAENARLQADYHYESELGPDRAQALRLSSLQPMTEVDPSSGTANPPRRRSTYRDALELVTAASMKRVRAELRIRGDRTTLDWLERFSNSELEQRGNALLESLFAGPMVLVKDPLRDRPKVVEPLKVAQEIMQGREVVAEDLIEVLERVPQDHLALTVSLLNEKWNSPGDAEAGEPDPRES
ncbi:unnamed protein product [Scytosiphon promiscuus]